MISKVYLLSDVCTDYTWVYHSVSEMKADDAALLRAELEAGTKYNLVHSRQVDYFLEAYPHLEAELVEAIREGRITLNPVRNMTDFANLSLEEIVRSFYPMVRFARKHGLETDLLRFANIQETPTAAWILPSIFANIGVKYLVRSLLPYECPWVKRLTEPPIYWWERTDGGRVLVRLRKEDYVEGSFVLKGVEAIHEALDGCILPEYQARSDYPFDAIGLVGCYGDLSPQSKEFPAQKAAAIAAYNAQAGEHAILIDASHADFWADIERQVSEREIDLPVRRGDYGTSWEAWPACLAADFAGYRRAQGRAMLADRLFAITHPELAGSQPHSCRLLLETAWEALISLADHAWNGSSEESRKLNASLRRGWQQEANAGFDVVITECLGDLVKRVPVESDGWLVFNQQTWPRSAVGKIAGEVPFTLVDKETGESVPVQFGVEGGEWVGTFIAPDVPGLGYRVLTILLDHFPDSDSTAKRGEAANISGADEKNVRISSPYYSLTIETTTGKVLSLYDKTRQVELVDPASAYHLNEAVYTTAPATQAQSYSLYTPVNFEGAVERRIDQVRIEAPARGPVFNQVTVHTWIGKLKVTSIYRLYHTLDRVDITNQVEKPISGIKEQLDFVFPFNLPQRQYRIEAPGVLLDPERDRLPGAGQSVHAVRRFVDVFNEQNGVMLAMLDSGWVQFGHQTTGEDPLAVDPSNATVRCLALGDVYDWNESVHDQGGETRFTFCYRLQGHAGGFDPVAAIHFGWDDDLETVTLPAGQRCGLENELPASRFSFLEISPPCVILTGMRAADEGGLFLRLWEVSGEPQIVSLQLKHLGNFTQAYRCNLLESVIEAIEMEDGKVSLSLQAHGLGAVLFK